MRNLIILPAGTDIKEGTLVNTIPLQSGVNTEDINAKKVFLPKDTVLLAGTVLPRGTVSNIDLIIGSYTICGDHKPGTTIARGEPIPVTYELISETSILTDTTLTTRASKGFSLQKNLFTFCSWTIGSFLIVISLYFFWNKFPPNFDDWLQPAILFATAFVVALFVGSFVLEERTTIDWLTVAGLRIAALAFVSLDAVFVTISAYPSFHFIWIIDSLLIVVLCVVTGFYKTTR